MIGEATRLGEPLRNRGLDRDAVVLFIMITPALAEAWLARNGRNRVPSKHSVAAYAAQMRSGDWTLNSTAITFSSEGRLLNGQNRLRACVLAEVPFPSIVIVGMPDASFLHEDVPRRRSRKDRLDISGEARTGPLADAIGWLFVSDQRKMEVLNPPVPSPVQEVAILERHPLLRHSVQFVCGHRFQIALGRAGMYAALHYLASKVDPAMADVFFETLASGEHLGGTQPVFQLRKRLLEDRAAKREMLDRVERVALVIKAWNLERHGRPCRALRWQRSVEGFPTFE